MPWQSVRILLDSKDAERFSDALMAVGALSVSLEDADAGTDVPPRGHVPAHADGPADAHVPAHANTPAHAHTPAHPPRAGLPSPLEAALRTALTHHAPPPF